MPPEYVPIVDKMLYAILCNYDKNLLKSLLIYIQIGKRVKLQGRIFVNRFPVFQEGLSN